MASWIMIVDDDSTNLQMAGRILSRSNMRVTALKSGRGLLDYVREKGAPDLILLDIYMPEMDGFETYRAYRELEKELNIASVPVVFLTADEDKSHESRGFELGVSDYIRKPFDPDVLVRRVTNIISTSGKMHKYEEEATIDQLTGFYNKYNATLHITEACLNSCGTLLIIDLDSFKLVNDIYGHDMGDRVLAAFSGIIKDNMKFPCIFGRIGGDEFLVFAENMKEEKDVAKFSEAINRSLVDAAKKMMGEDMGIPLGASIGAIFVPDQGTEFNDLFRLCDKALYVIKNNGKHGYCLYNDETGEENIPQDITLSMLTAILEERNISHNAMWMGKEAFGNVYKYMIRYMDRYRGTAYKMLFTAKFRSKLLSESQKEKMMVSLRVLLQESLRNSDIMMQIGDNHFFLLLPEISDYNVNRVIERVRNAWKNNEYSSLVDLAIETGSTDSEMRDSVNYKSEGENRIVIADDDPAELDHICRSLLSREYDVVAMDSADRLLE